MRPAGPASRLTRIWRNNAIMIGASLISCRLIPYSELPSAPGYRLRHSHAGPPVRRWQADCTPLPAQPALYLLACGISCRQNPWADLPLLRLIEMPAAHNIHPAETVVTQGHRKREPVLVYTPRIDNRLCRQHVIKRRPWTPPPGCWAIEKFLAWPSVAPRSQNTICVSKNSSRSSFGLSLSLRRLRIASAPGPSSFWYLRVDGTDSAWQKSYCGRRNNRSRSHNRSKRRTLKTV